MRLVIYFVAIPATALLIMIALSWAYHFGYIRGYRYMVEYIRKSKLQEAQDEFDRRVNNSQVRCLLLDSRGYLRYQKNEGEKDHPIFCDALHGWCNKNCQFFRNALYSSGENASFYCWLNPRHYIANWFHDPSSTTQEGSAS